MTSYADIAKDDLDRLISDDPLDVPLPGRGYVDARILALAMPAVLLKIPDGRDAARVLVLIDGSCLFFADDVLMTDGPSDFPFRADGQGIADALAFADDAACTFVTPDPLTFAAGDPVKFAKDLEVALENFAKPLMRDQDHDPLPIADRQSLLVCLADIAALLCEEGCISVALQPGLSGAPARLLVGIDDLSSQAASEWATQLVSTLHPLEAISGVTWVRVSADPGRAEAYDARAPEALTVRACDVSAHARLSARLRMTSRLLDAGLATDEIKDLIER